MELTPRWFSWLRDDDVFCIFTLNGVRFEMWEPWGDSNSVLVSADKTAPEEMERVFRAFAR